MAHSVEMRLDTTLNAHEAQTLASTLGWLCPTSFAAQIPDPNDGALALAAFHHEAFHYQQLISTPFGLHLACIDWQSTLRTMKIIRMLQVEGDGGVSIPLVNHLLHNTARQSDLDAIGESASVGVYTDWMMHADEVTDAGHLDAISYFHKSPLSLLANMGNVDAAAMFENFRNAANPKDFSGRSIGDTLVTTTAILENAATIATECFAVARIYAPADEFISLLAEYKPSEYYNLLSVVSELFENEPRVIDLAVIFCMIADLSLCGDLAIGLPRYGLERSWEESHPAWRFKSIVETLKSHDSIRRSFLSAGHEPTFAGEMVDKLAMHLGWTPPSQAHKLIDWDAFDVLGVPFTWAVKQFRDGISRRGECALLPPIVSYAEAVSAFLDDGSWHGVPEEEYVAALSESIQKGMEEFTLSAPFAQLNDGSAFYSTGEKERAYAISYYYASYFSKRMIFSNDLNYPVGLIAPDEVISLFTQVFRMSPEKVRVWPG